MNKYTEVFNDIQNKITSGLWDKGFLLPSEAELCAEYGMSRITIRRALDELERSGFVEKIQGKGSIVTGRKMRSGNVMRGFSQVMAEQGFLVSSKILKRELIQAPAGVANDLNLAPDAKVWHYKRLRAIGEVTLSVMDVYVAEEMGDRMNAYDLEHMSFYKLYEMLTGEPITRTKATVTAIIPSPEVYKLLNEPEGSAELSYSSIGYIGSRAVEVNHAIFNARYYEFEVNEESQKLSVNPTKLG